MVWCCLVAANHIIRNLWKNMNKLNMNNFLNNQIHSTSSFPNQRIWSVFFALNMSVPNVSVPTGTGSTLAAGSCAALVTKSRKARLSETWHWQLIRNQRDRFVWGDFNGLQAKQLDHFGLIDCFFEVMWFFSLLGQTLVMLGLHPNIVLL